MTASLKKTFNNTKPSVEEINSFVIAADEGNMRTIKEFIKRCPGSVNERGDCNSTALTYATMRGREEMVRLLVKNGADVNKENVHGNTPLMMAAIYRHNTLVAFLLEKEADLHAKNEYGRTALMLTAKEGHMDTLELLMEKDANPNEKDFYDMTAAAHARAEDNPEAAHLLEHWHEIKKQRQNAKELAEDIADFSPGLKRALPASRPLKSPRP